MTRDYYGEGYHFYGDLCEKIIKLELKLKNLLPIIKNLRYSLFWKFLMSNLEKIFKKSLNDTNKFMKSNDK